MKAKFAALAALITAAVSLSGALVRAAEKPVVYAKAYILMEPETGRILLAARHKERVYPASMTKVLTAEITLDYLNPDDIVICGPEVNSIPWDSSKAGLAEGEAISVTNLLRALLIRSGGDAAAVCAAAVARAARPDADTSTYARCEKIFRGFMNEKAKALGAADSNFINPHGYHDENHYSTAYDTALITKAALGYPLIAQIGKESGYSGPGADVDPADGYFVGNYRWTSHNNLLLGGNDFYQYATGLKTGVTDQAGECLAATAEKDGVTLIAVTCDSPVIDDGSGPSATRWADAKGLFEYGFNNYGFETIQTAGEPLGEAEVERPRLGAETRLPLAAMDGVSDYMTKAELALVTRSVSIFPEFAGAAAGLSVKAPVEKYQVVGRVVYTLDNAVIFTGGVRALADALPRTFNSDVDYYIAETRAALFGSAALPYWIIAGMGAVMLFMLVHIVKNRRRGNNSWGGR
jgi:D-alanyl-D-alanine carboxypeptidase (penicillin-binding protein 5/6)